MKARSLGPVARALLISWALIYLPYAILLNLATTGEDAIAGPSTARDNIYSAIWVVLSVLQAYIALVLYKRENPRVWLFWLAMVLLFLSVMSIAIGPIMLLLGYE